MNVSVHILLAAVCAVSFSSPQKGFDKFLDEDSDSSGVDPDGPIRGDVKVVQLHPRFFNQRPPISLFGLGAPRRILTPFLGLGRETVPARSSPGSLLKPRPHLQTGVGVEMSRKQGMEMWKKAIQRDSLAKEGLPVTLKEASQTACRAVSFRQVSLDFAGSNAPFFNHWTTQPPMNSQCLIRYLLKPCNNKVNKVHFVTHFVCLFSPFQRVSAPGCLTVTLQNKLCLGLCSSLFVPAVGDAGSAGARPEQWALSASCSRCAPVKTRTVLVPMLCEGVERVRERRVAVVEECQCESQNRGTEETLLRSLLLKR
ncbi:DAN domain family member 5 [Polyodon spathula]|uniref:DAN domain family member 5 n=1 Tax=Polyodon spathula TaxID=7913 RepID=UPI001B7EB2F3|nr:DAN domain family member 5 [Polyodon spathula]